jgi:hypothetical protein
MMSYAGDLLQDSNDGIGRISAQSQLIYGRALQCRTYYPELFKYR